MGKKALRYKSETYKFRAVEQVRLRAYKAAMRRVHTTFVVVVNQKDLDMVSGPGS
jgi:hypothetical protein